MKEQVPNPLYLASQFGLYSIAKMLIKNGADVNALSGREGSALQIAAFTNQVKIVKLLLENGANVEGNASENVEACATPLCAATIKNNITVMKMLLDNGADPNACGTDDHHVWYGPPLYHAYRNNYNEAISMLLRSGAKVKGRGSLREEVENRNIVYDSKSSQFMLSSVDGSALLRSGGRKPPPKSPTPSPESQAQRQSDQQSRLEAAMLLIRNRPDDSL